MNVLNPIAPELDSSPCAALLSTPKPTGTPQATQRLVRASSETAKLRRATIPAHAEAYRA